jgi:hypothetical protein
VQTTVIYASYRSLIAERIHGDLAKLHNLSVVAIQAEAFVVANIIRSAPSASGAVGRYGIEPFTDDQNWPLLKIEWEAKPRAWIEAERSAGQVLIYAYISTPKYPLIFERRSLIVGSNLQPYFKIHQQI